MPSPCSDPQGVCQSARLHVAQGKYKTGGRPPASSRTGIVGRALVPLHLSAQHNLALLQAGMNPACRLV